MGRQGGKKVHIILAREVLRLSRNPGKSGDVADHVNHDIRDDTPENLRVANVSQNGANRIKQFSCSRFPGVRPVGNKYEARIKANNGLRVSFCSMLIEIESGLMYWYADVILNGEFAYPTVFSPNEMPAEERQEELWQVVLTKLRRVGVLGT
jgi:hypothetical protein